VLDEVLQVCSFGPDHLLEELLEAPILAEADERLRPLADQP